MALPAGVSVDSVRAVYETLLVLQATIGGTGASAQSVRIDQTTPGTTNGVQLNAGTAQIGQVLLGPAATPTDGNSNTALTTQVRDSSGTARVGLSVAPLWFNGSTWDRQRKPNGTKILPSAAGSTNADFAKASAGDLWCISGFNAAASVRYLKIFNKAAAPTVGTDTPLMVIALPVGAFNLNFGGQYFATGIAFALTTGAPLLDTGAVTSGDIVGLTITYA